MTKEKEIELKILKEWEKEIGADKWSVWDSITSENIDLLLHKGFLAGQNSQKEKDLEIIKKGFEGCDDLVDLEKELTQKIKGKEKENVEM
jgi:hypothetical protein